MIKTFALRLKPGQDLKASLKEFVTQNQIQAGFILTAIGSLKQAELRFANQEVSTVLKGKFEILSLNGTLAGSGLHLHITIADGEGKTIGGHLANGCIIYTTAEIIIGESEDFRFTREVDSETGFLELGIRPPAQL